MWAEPGRQRHFCAIHSPKSANPLKVSPTCGCHNFHCNGKIIPKTFLRGTRGAVHLGVPGLCPSCPPHCYPTEYHRNCVVDFVVSCVQFSGLQCFDAVGWAAGRVYQKGTRKVKPMWILLKQDTVSGSGISWSICKSAPRCGQITTPAPHHSVVYRPDALPAAQPTASKH